MDDILLRLQRLEDIESIRRLKARYLHACDRKDVEAIRACFASGPIHIDYGVIGVFEQRDAFVQVYQEKACHPHIIDIHHSHNEQIDWHAPDSASATFDLFFYQINTDAGLLTQLGGYYDDNFRKVDRHWHIVSTRFVVTSTLVTQVNNQQLTPLFQGLAPPPI